MRKPIIIVGIIFLILIIITYNLTRPSVRDVVSENDTKVTEIMQQLRIELREETEPLKEQKEEIDNQINILTEEYSLRIDSFKKLLSKQYIDTCNESPIKECVNNITLSEYSHTVIPVTYAQVEIKEKKQAPHNYTDAKKLDDYFHSMYSPLNGYGQTFIDLANEYGVDGDFPVCITYADSSAGKNMTSKNNPGNTFNNDSGTRVGFPRMEDGIEAIFYTIGKGTYQQNNSLVGHYSNGGRIAMGLPQSGTKGVYIYASSLKNWNNRVKECMTELKGQLVDEWFKVK